MQDTESLSVLETVFRNHHNHDPSIRFVIQTVDALFYHPESV
ncbi:hypothetical protein [Haloferax sp. Atlit-6N]